MNLQYRVDLLVRLGKYILANDTAWLEVKEKAGIENGWFISEFVELSTNNIARRFLQADILKKWIATYDLPEINTSVKTVGIVMAGNIPLVGFHDLMCVFISGHRAAIKTSSKDDVLIKHLAATMAGWDERVNDFISFAPMLKGCDAYIATGSNNSSGYFEYYFGKFKHIIRRNRTSVAILRGNETRDELGKLADDVFQFFGLGCRNVTKLYVPKDYDFISLIQSFKKYDYLADHHKYKNNYDYNLALHLLNKKFYMSTPALLVVEDVSLFSPISQLNFEYYDDPDKLTEDLRDSTALQCIIGSGHVSFGQSQAPAIDDYADGVDTLQFVSRL